MENIYFNFMKNGIDFSDENSPLNLYKYKHQHDDATLMRHIRNIELESRRMINTSEGLKQMSTIGGIIVDNKYGVLPNIVNYYYFAWKMSSDQDKNMYYIHEEYNATTGTSAITSTLVGYAEVMKPGYVPNRTETTSRSNFNY